MERFKRLDSPGVEWAPIHTARPDSIGEAIKTLSQTLLFEGLSTRDWRHLTPLFHHRQFADDEIVCAYGTPGLGMYIIVSGAVKVVMDRGSETLELARLQSGDFFGEMSLIDDYDRSATVVAVGETRLIGIFRPQLQELIVQRPKLGVVLLNRLAIIIVHRLREANRMLVEKGDTSRLAHQ